MQAMTEISSESCCHRSAHTPGSFCGVGFPPAFGSRSGARRGSGRLLVPYSHRLRFVGSGPNLGCRRNAGATLAVLSVVVI